MALLPSPARNQEPRGTHVTVLGFWRFWENGVTIRYEVREVNSFRGWKFRRKQAGRSNGGNGTAEDEFEV